MSFPRVISEVTAVRKSEIFASRSAFFQAREATAVITEVPFIIARPSFASIGSGSIPSVLKASAAGTILPL